MSRTTRIVKSNGDVEPFRERKLRRSLERSGATRREIRDVVRAVRAHLEDGMTTRALYRLAFRELRHAADRATGTPARYSLKRAIQALGPSGYPFERFVAALFEAEGERTATSVHFAGRFVRHEVDVVVGSGASRQLCECKLRTQQDGKVDVKVAMYIYGRAADLRGIPGGYDRFWIVTNGRFTSDAIAFGEGMGLGLVGWGHPTNAGFAERIEAAAVHPLTALTSLRTHEKRTLLQAGVVLCRELLDAAKLGRLIGLSPPRAERVRAEVHGLIAAAGERADQPAGRASIATSSPRLERT